MLAATSEVIFTLLTVPLCSHRAMLYTACQLLNYTIFVQRLCSFVSLKYKKIQWRASYQSVATAFHFILYILKAALSNGKEQSRCGNIA
jgi:hypothetical protein